MVSATLEVNLSALRANYRLLRDTHAKKNVAAVVKANAYGLGVEEVSKTLWSEGCREFFVATLEEGVQLRGVLPEAVIGVFSGIFAGEEKEFSAHRLTPVLNDLGMVERFAQGAGFGIQDSGIIHIDTGMTRLGLSTSELTEITSRILNPESRILLLSHLACANAPQHPKNAEQLLRFREALALFPNARASLANSAGIFLSPEFHFDVARPGCALYGISPHDGTSPMAHVATLSAPILQIRTLDRDETVGYGATASLKKGARLAIAGLGYADGYFRKLSNLGVAYVAGHKVPVVGRVSMDMIALDVSALPELPEGVRAEFINAQHTVDDVAREAGTIGYEIFTRIGRRVQRVYSQ
ncbi:MAG: alanine racemase [Alphaproteobacteria bacterium]|nr:alanine racemase [Alphaproteobacteria bacterium]